jgi:hypothetical protein
MLPPVSIPMLEVDANLLMVDSSDSTGTARMFPVRGGPDGGLVAANRVPTPMQS